VLHDGEVESTRHTVKQYRQLAVKPE